MSKQVVDSPEIEAKILFDTHTEGEGFLFEYFLDNNSPPDGVTEEDYLKELRQEYYKLKREEARRLLGLDKK